MKAWYLPTASIAGTAAALDFSTVFRRGGYLVSMATWSLDAGYGLDDYAVWITSEGEVAVYRGTDPSSASTWALIGVYEIGSPIGNRCFTKYGGDLLLISRDGLVPFSKELMSSRVNTQVALTSNIQTAISSATASYAANFGWECVLYPNANMMILNVPLAEGSQQQFVMNTITGAWAQFMGWNANCWARYKDEVYFGTNGKVCKAWQGHKDGVSAIFADGLQAFSYFGSASQLKHFKMGRPVITTNGGANLNIGINVDFDQISTLSTPSLSPSSYGTWDVSTWDNALWGGPGLIKKDWQWIGALGYSAGMHFKASVLGNELSWVSSDYVFEPGGII